MSKGFTLIEVLVVSVIIAILAAVAIPSMEGYIERSADKVCEHTASMLLKSVYSYILNERVIADNHYTLEQINAELGKYKIALPPTFSADVWIESSSGKYNITVMVQDTQYMGTATLGS